MGRVRSPQNRQRQTIYSSSYSCSLLFLYSRVKSVRNSRSVWKNDNLVNKKVSSISSLCEAQHCSQRSWFTPRKSRLTAVAFDSLVKRLQSQISWCKAWAVEMSCRLNCQRALRVCVFWPLHSPATCFFITISFLRKSLFHIKGWYRTYKNVWIMISKLYKLLNRIENWAQTACEWIFFS